jgi:hypothetical protein
MTRPVRRARTQAATRKDYSAIARKKITTPGKLADSTGGVRRPSILVYSRNKKGKTRFCLTAGRGKILIVDPEHGTDRFVKAAPNVWHLDSWEEIDDIYKFLRSGDHNYEWVAFDGLTRISNMALRFVMKRAEEADLNRRPGQVTQRDYGNAGELFKQMLYQFHTLPLGVIYTAQERQIDAGEGDDEDEDVELSNIQYVPDLPKGSRAAVNSIVDCIGRIYTVKIPGEDGNNVVRRRLWLAPSVSYDTGCRSEFKIPDYLENPTVPRLVALMEGQKLANK